MSIQISPVVRSEMSHQSDGFTVESIELEQFGTLGGPLIVLDQFRVKSHPFGPHPHAGFSAVTYVFEDSEGSLRSRDSLGNDYIVGPGGIVWAQAGSGMTHEEMPQDLEKELHGLQMFVELSAQNKQQAPHVYKLTSDQVPEWYSDCGDRVRVVVGSYGGLVSPLKPSEPFDFLDINLKSRVRIGISKNRNVVVYALKGKVRVCAGKLASELSSGNAVALTGRSKSLVLETQDGCHCLVLQGAMGRTESLRRKDAESL